MSLNSEQSSVFPIKLPFEWVMQTILWSTTDLWYVSLDI